MRVLGLVGGIASGKSLVARQFEQLGAVHIDADRTGHEVLRWPAIIQAIRDRWGDSVLTHRQTETSLEAHTTQTPPEKQPHGSDNSPATEDSTLDDSTLSDSTAGDSVAVDRAALAARVFAPTPTAHRDLEYLNQLVHPAITQLVVERIAKLRREGKVPVVVVDAPLLIEAGWHTWCDLVVLVDCPRQQRLERARQRGWSEAEFAAREAAQLDTDTKRNLAQSVIDNSGTEEQTQRQVAALWHQLLAPAA